MSAWSPVLSDGPPTADSVSNSSAVDVIGNKLDTVAGDSLVALNKINTAALVVIDGFHDVPGPDSVADTTIRDVVGQKGDSVAGTSLVALARQALVALGIIDGYHDVAGVDDAANTTIRDVLGQKGDTAGGTSLVALARQALAALVVIDGFHDVPGVDSVANATITDSLGQKGDTHAGTSAMAFLDRIDDHIHSEMWVLPDLGASITATAGLAWVFGVESASLGTPGADFDLHWIEIVANNNAEYQARILVGGVPVCEFDFERIGAGGIRSFSKYIQMNVTAAGAITIQLASSAPGATARFKVNGHDY